MERQGKSADKKLKKGGSTAMKNWGEQNGRRVNFHHQCQTTISYLDSILRLSVLHLFHQFF